VFFFSNKFKTYRKLGNLTIKVEYRVVRGNAVGRGHVCDLGKQKETTFSKCINAAMGVFRFTMEIPDPRPTKSSNQAHQRLTRELVR